jgi:hypothetical protein
MDVHHLPQLYPDTAAAAAEALTTSRFYTVISTRIMPDNKTGNEVC